MYCSSKNQNKNLIVFLILLILLLIGCNMPMREIPSQEIISTAAAQTKQAELTLVSQPPVTSAGETNQVAATITSTPIDDITVTVTPQDASVTSSPNDETAQVCDLAEFVKDITVPDGTEFSPGTNFEKVWQLKNTGTCTWTSDYQLVVEGENVFNAPLTSSFTAESIAPGESVDISVALQSPTIAGSYRGNFKLVNASGQTFGLKDGTKPFWADIKVVVGSGIVFDFVARAVEAQWKSGQGGSLDTDLEFGGTDDDPNGTAKIKDEVLMENGSISGKLLATFPKRIDSGIVAGSFPEHFVQNGDRFIARLGFEAEEEGDCGFAAVTYKIGFQEEFGTVNWINEWQKTCDGELYYVNYNLSSLKGKSIQFVLQVEAIGSFKENNALWISPRIER